MKCPFRPKYKRFLWWRWVIGCEDCLKEKCAWWHEGLEECRLVTLDDSIATIMGTLLNLSLDLDKSGKLPHWQPTAEEKAKLLND